MCKNDELLNRFTAYMKVIVRHAKVDYMRKLNWKRYEIATEAEVIAELSQSAFPIIKSDDFAFENQALETAFEKLSELRKQILKMVFIDDMKPSEIADALGCPVDFVYREKTRGIKKLKELIERMDANG